jgi:AcrR family transcriptional regulator
MGASDWLQAARLALIRGGPAAVRIEKLARELKVTKGSFYWHFKDREHLLETLLHEWEDETESLFREVAAFTDAGEAFQFLGEYVQKSMSSPPGKYPPDIGIFNWAATDPKVATRVNRIERIRIDTLIKLIGRPERVELAYLVWLGFIFRRHRSPGTGEDLPFIWSSLVDFLLPAQTRKPSSGKARRKERKPYD